MRIMARRMNDECSHCHLASRVRVAGKNAFRWNGNSRRAWRSRHHGSECRRMNDNVQQETQRVDQDVSLETLDLLARVVARTIKPRPRCAICGNQGE